MENVEVFGGLFIMRLTYAASVTPASMGVTKGVAAPRFERPWPDRSSTEWFESRWRGLGGVRLKNVSH